MSRIIATAAIRGAHSYVEQAKQELDKTIEAFGPEKNVEFPNTAYYLPVILALMGLEVKTTGDAQKALEHAERLLPPVPTSQLWVPYLGSALDAGIATLIAEEIIEALKYVNGLEPEEPWLGFTDDAILRTQGIKLVDGRMPGFAACVGALPTNEQAVELARSLQERNILVFMASSANGHSMAEQLAEEGVEMNWDTFLVPYGKDTSASVYALNFAARAAMTLPWERILIRRRTVVSSSPTRNMPQPRGRSTSASPSSPMSRFPRSCRGESALTNMSSPAFREMRL